MALAPVKSTVTNPAFRDFVAGLRGGYFPACPVTVKRIVSVLKVLMEKKLLDMISQAPEQWGQLATPVQADLWSINQQHEPYGVVNASFFINDLEYINILLDINFPPHDSHTPVAIVRWWGSHCVVMLSGFVWV